MAGKLRNFFYLFSKSPCIYQKNSVPLPSLQLTTQAMFIIGYKKYKKVLVYIEVILYLC